MGVERVVKNYGRRKFVTWTRDKSHMEPISAVREFGRAMEVKIQSTTLGNVEEMKIFISMLQDAVNVMEEDRQQSGPR